MIYRLATGLGAALLMLIASTAHAQTNNPCGLLVMAHGGSESWNAAVETAVAPLMHEVPTSIAFGMANPATLAASVAELEGQGVPCIAVVRLFVSAQSFLHQTEYLLGLRDDAPRFFVMMPNHGTSRDPNPIEVRAKIRLNEEGLMDAPEMGSVLADRALALSDPDRPEAVLVIAHGPGDDTENRLWLSKINGLADSIRVSGAFTDVAVHTLREDWQDKRAGAEKGIRAFVTGHTSRGVRVLVVPFRLYGFGPYADVLEGLEYESSGDGLLPSPHVTDWIRSQYEKITGSLLTDEHASR